MSLTSFRKYCLTILLACFYLFAYTQKPDSAEQTQKVDTSNPSFVDKLQKLGHQETINSIEKYRLGRIAIKQKYLVEEIKNTAQKARIYLKKGLDTLSVLKELKNSDESLNLVKEGVFVNKGTIQTQRNLAVSSAILTELLFKMKDVQQNVTEYNNNLLDFRDRIDSLSVDSALYTFPSDSLASIKYIRKIAVVVKELGPTDSLINHTSSSVQDLQTQVDIMVYNLHSALEDVERYRTELTTKSFSRELPFLTDPSINDRPLSEIIDFSLSKEKLALNFYVRDSAGRIFILFVLIIVASLFTLSLKKKLQEENSLDPEYKGQLVLRYPRISAVFIIINIFQFIFLDPPFIFAFFLWLISAICLSFIFKKFISRYWMQFWLLMILFFILSAFDNMVLQVSRSERWFILGLSFVGLSFCTYVLLRGKKYELRERGLLFFIAFVVVAEVISFLCNIFGRFNLSKTLLVIGYTGIIIAVLFLWTVRLLNEMLGLIARVYKHPDKRLFYINFEKIGDRVPRIFYPFLVLGWAILVGRNSYSFKQMAGRFNEFLTTERTLGNYTFSINGLFVFFLILTCSVLLSRIISFFAEPGDAHKSGTKKPGKVGIGSWLLLIRIFIISLGLFLAFAASGIPLDKITIIVGALGVGVGLGLQGLVNNLVSGLIIAFEKPVNVGDNIEINNKTGTMKSIGFRSSVVALEDGAHLIIPNGDLLSQHLINWTMGKNIKRIAIKVSVAYNTDLDKAKQILNKILEQEDRILQYPVPVVAASAFNAGAIDFDLFFWLNHRTASASILKSDIISRVNSAFNEAGIIIPIPQQDLYIRSVPNGEELKNGEKPILPPSTDH